jgi:hypothetical protein
MVMRDAKSILVKPKVLALLDEIAERERYLSRHQTIMRLILLWEKTNDIKLIGITSSIRTRKT